MANVNPSNGNKTISDIFSVGHIQMWHRNVFYQKILKYFNDFQKSEFLSYMTKVNPNKWNEKNQTFLHGKYSNLELFLIGRKILKYFNDAYNWHFSISLQKWAQTSKVK